MPRIKTIVLASVIAGLAVTTVYAERTATATGTGALKVAEGTPDRYTVVKGDTLWGISSKFLLAPTRWPALWKGNQESIKDPHKIYPGDVLRFDRLGEAGVATGKTPASDGKRSPRGKTVKGAKAPVVPAAAVRPPGYAPPAAPGKDSWGKAFGDGAVGSRGVRADLKAGAAETASMSAAAASEAAKAAVPVAPAAATPTSAAVAAAAAAAAAAKEAEAAAAARSVEAADADNKKEKVVKKPQPDLIMKGDGVCTVCHEESDDYPVLSIGATKHGVRADARTPTCVSCHGESGAHLKVPKGSKGQRPLPDYPFGKKTLKDVAKHNQSCLQCHQGEKLTLWTGSPHSRRDVACVQCHKLHTRTDDALSRVTVSNMCMNCHTEKKAMINRPSRHPVLEGKVVCTDCHAAHGSAGPKLMAKDSVVQTCYTCHMEKRGPFLWNHLPVTQDCSICHNPHGSVNPNLLKQRPPYLCQQCHEPTSHRGNMGVLVQQGSRPIGGAENPFGFQKNDGTAGGPNNVVPAQARACLNCHSNIHGGNNPTNTSNSRSFRR